MSRASLSLCMIVKNEADMLGDCLESIADIADQIVVVDTGSKDDTIKIAKQFNAEIHHHEWQNNFAKARNQSLQYATGDWIFWMDADERLLPESRSELIKLLKPESRALAYKVQIKNLQKDKETYIFSDGHRLFTNNKGICFNGRIHEQISPSIKEIGGTIKNSSINLLHLGYSYTGEKENRKNSRNRYLLKKMVEEEPQNAYAHYTLGQFYALNKQHQKAINHYQTALNLAQLPVDMTSSLLNMLGEEFLKIDKYQEAERYINKSLETINVQVGGYYLLYKIAEKRGQLKTAIEYLKTILKNNRKIKNNKKHISTDVVIEDYKIFHTIGNLYYKNKNYKLAYKFLDQAFKTNRKNKDCIKKLAYLSLKLERKDKLREMLKYINKFDINDTDYLKNIANHMIQKGHYEYAIGIYQRILQLIPENKLALKRMAGLYAKIGNRSKAEALVAKLQTITK